MKKLFQHLHEVEGLIKNSTSVVLFLDYDGTLVPIKEKPDDAKIAADMQKLLKKISALPKYQVIVISGRTIEDLRDITGIKEATGIWLAGIHGLELSTSRSKGKKFILEKEKAKSIENVLRKIKAEISDISNEEGVYIEDKNLAVALHYRRVRRGKVKEVKEKFIEKVRKYDTGDLEIIQGKEVLEVRQKGWDKGKAVEMILKRFPKAFPIYIGDDTTDEDAFRYLKDNGITALVSKIERETNAKFYLRDQNEVFLFLNRILDVQ
jgi:trehalose 6-phosphate phosphatase